MACTLWFNTYRRDFGLCKEMEPQLLTLNKILIFLINWIGIVLCLGKLKSRAGRYYALCFTHFASRFSLNEEQVDVARIQS